MAEETELVDEKKPTELCVNRNTVVNSPLERSISGSRSTENISGEHTAAECLIMGASLQPRRESTEAFKVQKEPPKRDDSYPSSLRSTSTSCSSYSLEISVSTATTNNSNKESRPLPLKTPPESRDGQNHEAKPSSPLVDHKPFYSVTKSYKSSDPTPLQEREQLEKFKFRQYPDKHDTSEIVTPKSPNIESGLEKTFLSIPSGGGKVGAQPVSTSKPPEASSTQEVGKHDSFSTEKQASQEEEDMFYAFVILHAEEDSEEAVRLKSRLESISSTIGATFSEDFAVPGQSTFRSVEDAIENSAYVMLLLTPNFNTHLNETNADSALMNSIEKPHKHNTVIPLLPRANGLTRNQMPFILRTKNPLVETRDRDTFEKMAKKVLDLRNIQRQKSMWTEAQLVKKQREKQQWLQEKKRYCKDFIQESPRVRELEEQIQQLKMQQQHLQPPYAQQTNSHQGFPGRPQSSGPMPFRSPSPMPSYYSGNMWPQLPSNIHIQNAKCIMIGNNSTMTVGGGVDSGDEDNF
ncbi:TIR domain-containing adapter molecule 1 isoform X1 [Ictalurus punctatus]|uniref:TIR domain-containing adapter molecule 1 isoform X1 n=1 Tax=Ictalurus punctatus TaxID=7998 RepID=A0A979F1A8_ICTPU|nr:TIR domain-containing adapter molecule 1 isoform X1 [Ictalurus punctatus]